MTHIFVRIAIGCLLLTGAMFARDNVESVVKMNEQSGQGVVPGMVVVKFTNSMQFGERTATTGIVSLDERFREIGVIELRQLLPSRAMHSGIANPVSIESIYNVSYRGDADPQQIAAALTADPNIEYAEPKYTYPLADTPNDPQYAAMSQFPQVQASQAWDVVKGEQGSVVIAVVDGGTDWDHEDLVTNIWTNPGEIAGNGIDDDANGFVDDIRGWNFANSSNDPTGLSNTPQSAGHGTHVSGTAGGVTNNGIGVSSISWNCEIMGICAASPTADRIVQFGYDGISYAVANGADIINCSWGGAGNASRLEQDVINFAYANNVLIVAAAGNAGSNNDALPHYPSNYNHVLAVGATNKTSDVKAGFSNYGATVDVFAPGVGIYSTTPNNTYSSAYSGTSMASPMAAGLAGLVKTANPGHTVDQLREQIRVTCDPIDAVNPGISGLTGKGRINALRAVTDFSIPAIRLSDVSFTDSGSDGIVDAGETIDLTLEFINYLAASGNVSVTLSSEDNLVSVTSEIANLGTMNSNDVLTGSFQFSVSAAATNGHVLRFFLDITDGTYSDRDFFTLTVTPPSFASHNTGILQTSITTQGNIGFTGFDGTPGVGFVYNSNGYLFEGGLMIGTGTGTVSDCIRGADGSTQDDDFLPATGEDLSVVSPGAFSNEEGAILLTDSLAATPLGISVLQKSYADNRTENQDFVIFHYTIFNNNATALNNVHAGLFFDWDINSTANDYVRYDSDRNMLYAMNNASAPTRLVGTRLLTNVAGGSFKAVHNSNEIYDGFSDSEKWSFLSGGLQTQSLDNTDISTLVGTGPLSIPPNSSVEIAFAVIGANTLADLQQHADNAQTLWDNPTAIDDLPNPVADDFELAQNYPNPFNPTTTIEYRLATAGNISLKIFNIAGQEVRTLVNAAQTAGRYSVNWDGRDNRGMPVASGVYFYRLETQAAVQSRKMLLIR